MTVQTDPEKKLGTQIPVEAGSRGEIMAAAVAAPSLPQADMLMPADMVIPPLTRIHQGLAAHDGLAVPSGLVSSLVPGLGVEDQVAPLPEPTIAEAPAPPTPSSPAQELPMVPMEELGQVVIDGAAPAPETETAKAARLLAAQYKSMPGLIGDMVGGGTVDEVQASMVAAKAAYVTVKAQVMQEMSSLVPSARSGGGPAPAPATSIGKISAGLAAAERMAKK